MSKDCRLKETNAFEVRQRKTARFVLESTNVQQ